MQRTIHTFWSGSKNDIVEACFARMRSANPGWSVVVHTDFVEADLHPKFEDLPSIQAKSDWLRICLISNLGGVWLDASIVCLKSIETWLDVNDQRVVGFETPFYCETPILENWAFAARPHHPLLLAWKNEFAEALSIGFNEYKTRFDPKHCIYELLPYLTMHAAYTRVHRSDWVLMHHSLDKTFGPFFYLTDSLRDHTSSTPAIMKMFFSNIRHPPLLKMRSVERTIATHLLRVLPVIPGSFMYEYLELRTPLICMIVPLLVLVVILTCIYCIYGSRKSSYENEMNSDAKSGIEFWFPKSGVEYAF